MPKIRETTSPVAHRLEQYRGSRHDFFHGSEPNPRINTTRGRRRGQSPVPIRGRSPIIERRELPRSPRRRQENRRDIIRDDPQSSYHNSADTYRPKYGTEPKITATDLEKEQSRPPLASAALNVQAVAQNRGLRKDSTTDSIQQRVLTTQISPTSPPVSEAVSEAEPEPEPMALDSPKPVPALASDKSLSVFQERCTQLVEALVESTRSTQNLQSTGKILEQRIAESHRTANYHDRFANTKAYTTEERDRASKKHQIAEDHLRDSNKILNERAFEFVQSTVVPYIAASVSAEVSKHEDNASQALVEQLKAQCEATSKACNVFRIMAEKNQKSFEDYKKQSEKKSEETETTLRQVISNNVKLQTDLETLKNQFTEQKSGLSDHKTESQSKLEETMSNLSNLRNAYESANTSLKKEISVLNEKVTQTRQNVIDQKAAHAELRSAYSFSKDSTERELKRLHEQHGLLSSLSTRITASEQNLDLANSELRSIEEKVEVNTRLSKALEEGQSGCLMRINQHQQRLDQLPTTQPITAEELDVTINNRLISVNARMTSLEGTNGATAVKIRKLEEIPQQDVEEMENLKDRLSRIEERPSIQVPAPTHTVSLDSNQSLRLVKLEADMADFKGSWQSKMQVELENNFDEVIRPYLEAESKLVNADIENCRATAEIAETLTKSGQEENLKKFEAMHQELALLKQSIPTSATITNVENSVGELQQQLQVVHTGLANHETRINNVSTAHIAAHIVDQLPYGQILRDVQALQGIRAEYDQDIRTISAKATESQQAVANLQISISNNSVTIADRFGDVIPRLDALRSDVDVLKSVGPRVDSLKDDVDHKLVSVQTQLDNLTTVGEKVSGIEQELLEFKQELSKVQQELLGLATVQTSITDMHESVEAAGIFANSLNTRIDNMQAQFDGISSDVKELNALKARGTNGVNGTSRFASTPVPQNPKPRVPVETKSVPDASSAGSSMQSHTKSSGIKRKPDFPATSRKVSSSQRKKNGSRRSPANKKVKRTGLVEDSQSENDGITSDDNDPVITNPRTKVQNKAIVEEEESLSDSDIEITSVTTINRSGQATTVRKFESRD